MNIEQHVRNGALRAHPRQRVHRARACVRTTGTAIAFTVIEMVGALAVIAILASVLVPVVAKQVDKAVWTKEVSDLSAISNAIVLQAVRYKAISNDVGWAQAAANWLNLPVTQIANNPRSMPRVFVIDPGLQLGPSGLPYTQTPNGTSRPSSARVMILSAIAGPNLPLSSGVIPGPTFNDIWNTPTLAKPPSLAWQGKGEDLVIQRINFEPLFYRLILNDRGGDPHATFTIDTNQSPQYIQPDGSGWWAWDSYYLDSTFLQLGTNNGVQNVVQMQALVKHNVSYAFENGNWQAQIVNNPATNNDPATSFYVGATNFLTLYPTNAALLSAMLGFILDYNMAGTNSPQLLGNAATNLTGSIASQLSLPDLLGGLLKDHGH